MTKNVMVKIFMEDFTCHSNDCFHMWFGTFNDIVEMVKESNKADPTLRFEIVAVYD